MTLYFTPNTTDTSVFWITKHSSAVRIVIGANLYMQIFFSYFWFPCNYEVLFPADGVEIQVVFRMESGLQLGDLDWSQDISFMTIPSPWRPQGVVVYSQIEWTHEFVTRSITNMSEWPQSIVLSIMQVSFLLFIYTYNMSHALV